MGEYDLDFEHAELKSLKGKIDQEVEQIDRVLAQAGACLEEWPTDNDPLGHGGKELAQRTVEQWTGLIKILYDVSEAINNVIEDLVRKILEKAEEIRTTK